MKPVKATVAKQPPVFDTWRSYQRLFSDDLEAANRAPMTIRTYLIAVEQLGEFLAERGMPADPTRVTREHLTEWMRYLPRPKSEGGQGVAAATALQRYRSISAFFKWLVDTDEITENPMAKMRPPHLPEKLVPVIADSDLRKLFRVCGGAGFEERRDKAIISLFLDTGMRLAELAGIRLSALDLDEREVTVMGKGRRPRTLRFVKETRGDLQRYLLARNKHVDREEDALWLGRRGPLTANGIYQTIQRRCTEAGIPAVHPHQFRHTFAHLYLKSGGNEGDLMKVTGWRSRSMIDRYGASVASVRAAEAHDRFSPRKLLQTT